MIKFCLTCNSKVIPIGNKCPSCGNGLTLEISDKLKEENKRRLEISDKISENKYLKNKGRKDAATGFVLFIAPMFMIMKFEIIGKWILFLVAVGAYKLAKGLPYALMDINKFEKKLREGYSSPIK